MSEQKTRPGEATPRRAGTEKTTGQASIPNSYSTTIPRRRQVSAFLRVGKEHAIKRADLAALTGMGERVLRRQIQRERQQGNLIISDCHGYFLPETTEDIRIFVAQMRHRAREINAVTLAAERALAEAEGQTMMEGWK